MFRLEDFKKRSQGFFFFISVVFLNVFCNLLVHLTPNRVLIGRYRYLGVSKWILIGRYRYVGALNGDSMNLPNKRKSLFETAF